MIEVSKLNDKEFFINCDLIECIEATPDTTISITTGKKVVVKQTVNEVVERIIEYKRKIYAKY